MVAQNKTLGSSFLSSFSNNHPLYKQICRLYLQNLSIIQTLIHIFPANAKPEPMLKATLYLLIPNKQMCWGGQAPGWSEERPSQNVNSPAGRRGGAVGPIRRGVGCQSLLVSLGSMGRLAGTKGYPTFLPRDH